MHVLITKMSNAFFMVIIYNSKPVTMHHIVEHNLFVQRARCYALWIMYFDAIRYLIRVPQVVLAKCL